VVAGQQLRYALASGLSDSKDAKKVARILSELVRAMRRKGAYGLRHFRVTLWWVAVNNSGRLACTPRVELSLVWG
jgi:hypothetical protein